MKKKYIILIIIGIFLLVLLIPKVDILKDGGTKEYKSLSYKITKLKKLDFRYEENTKTGIIIEVFGKKVYEKITSKKIKVKLETNSSKYFIDESILLETGHEKSFKEGLIPIKKNEKIGFMNKKGEIVIEPIYDSAFPFVNGTSRVLLFPENPSPTNGGKHGYIDTNGNQISKIEYGYANDFSEEYGLVCINEIENFQKPCDPSALVDKKGNIVIDSRNKDYNIIYDVKDGLLIAIKDEKYGFVDTQGNVVIDFKYKYASYFKYGYAIVTITDDKLILIDKNDKQILDLSKYTHAYFMNEKFIAVEENNKWGLIDLEGDKTVDTIYNYLTNIYEDYLVVSITPDTFKLINTKGDIILDLKDYDMVGSISEGLIGVRKDNKYGFIDLKGTNVIDIQYDSTGNFSEGLAYVVKDGKEMFIDKENNIILSYK